MNEQSITVWGRFKRWGLRLLFVLGGFLLFYLAFFLLGFVPTNLDYQVPPINDQVVLFVRSNDIHTDVVMPVDHDVLGIHWREHFPQDHFPLVDIQQAPYVAVGWGDRGFYLETPSWEELKWSNVANALCWPSASVLHVEYLGNVVPDEYTYQVAVSKEQYQQLAAFVQETISANKSGQAVPASEITYGIADRFYQSHGEYHLFNTCNQWTGQALRTAGLPMGIWTPWKSHVLYWLPVQGTSSRD